MELEEIWEDIKGYEGTYQASNLGRIRSLNYKRTGEIKILSQAKQKNGYMLVILAKNGKKKGFNIHRLIANTFIPNNQDKSQVNHINGNKTDNRVSNLEWVTPKENSRKAYEMGLKKTGKFLYNTRWIYQFDLNMKFIKKWESMTQASKKTNIGQGDISKCCMGKRKSAGNFIWLNDDGLLNHLTKQDKMIELMSRFIDTELSSDHLSKVLKIEVKPLETYREDIKQYFEKKAEESE